MNICEKLLLVNNQADDTFVTMLTTETISGHLLLFLSVRKDTQVLKNLEMPN